MAFAGAMIGETVMHLGIDGSGVEYHLLGLEHTGRASLGIHPHRADHPAIRRQSGVGGEQIENLHFLHDPQPVRLLPHDMVQTVHAGAAVRRQTGADLVAAQHEIFEVAVRVPGKGQAQVDQLLHPVIGVVDQHLDRVLIHDVVGAEHHLLDPVVEFGAFDQSRRRVLRMDVSHRAGPADGGLFDQDDIGTQFVGAQGRPGSTHAAADNENVGGVFPGLIDDGHLSSY